MDTDPTEKFMQRALALALCLTNIHKANRAVLARIELSGIRIELLYWTSCLQFLRYGFDHTVKGSANVL